MLDLEIRDNLPLLIHPDLWMRLEENKLLILDRRKLPRQIEFITCQDYEDVARSIEDMVVQGAVDLAITAGYGLLLAAQKKQKEMREAQAEGLRQAAMRLKNTRPTGHYLASMINKLLDIGLNALAEGQEADGAIHSALRELIKARDDAAQSTGRFAETILENGDTIMTHCFAATVLLYMLMFAQENGKAIKVFATETRPYLQGQRLTSFAIKQLGIPVTLITDNMPAYCMAQGLITKVFTAADRIAMDGSAANKVGTLQYAIIAHYHRIPFYIFGYCGPDAHTAKGTDIPIEERDPEEVLSFAGQRIAADGVKGFYPAFDVTPPTLISGIITDRGIFPAHLIKNYLAAPENPLI
ncbi:Initiation factor 2B alpha/beta/delta [Moorella glycerini]|uniref:Methylthioribose-1-phosphate isomerase n=1 Tax=Neomoorella stamsii TaxID=1266720 RepID=A0A9X7J617_9FIRM|nr:MULTISPECIES: s-methyl-5-thioribose-1-phosphate isomerase [Moorella]PRR76100.1 Methylthioribose-1-phosphate isomerase [Moorella stamsii]CEP68294.1 Initiation factor 2B alpha/beta/delta [Moorella glycerini]